MKKSKKKKRMFIKTLNKKVSFQALIKDLCYKRMFYYNALKLRIKLNSVNATLGFLSFFYNINYDHEVNSS